MQSLGANLVPDNGEKDLRLLLAVPGTAREERQPIGIDGLHHVGELELSNFLQMRVFGPGAPWHLL